MSAADSRAKLVQASKKLLLDWQRVREAWRDQNCVQFDKQYVQPLEASIRVTVLAMERMAGMIEKAEHDCGDSREPSV